MTWVQNDFAAPPDTHTGTLNSNPPYSVAISPTSGAVYAGYYLQFDDDTEIFPNGIHVSSNGGVTFDNDNVVLALGFDSLGDTLDCYCLTLPYGDDSTFYYGDQDDTAFKLYRNSDDITPVHSAALYGMQSGFARLAIGKASSNILALVGHNGTALRYFRSTDGGSSWTLVGTDPGSYATTPYQHCALFGDDESKTLWYGTAVGVSDGVSAIVGKTLIGFPGGAFIVGFVRGQ
jgi:hypothetical protein